MDGYIYEHAPGFLKSFSETFCIHSTMNKTLYLKAIITSEIKAVQKSLIVNFHNDLHSEVADCTGVVSLSQQGLNIFNECLAHRLAKIPNSFNSLT